VSRRIISRLRFGLLIRFILLVGLSLWIARSSSFDRFFSWLGGTQSSLSAQAHITGYPSTLPVQKDSASDHSESTDKIPSSIITDIPIPLKLDFKLLRHDNEIISSQWYLGKTVLVFFGFTSCPIICPTTLGTITQVMKTLPEDVNNNVQPLFISVDPERDDVFRLKDYASMFDPSIHYFTGTISAVDNAAKSLRSYYKRHRQNGTDNTYDVDHSVFIYVINPQGYSQAIIPPTVSVEDITRYLADTAKH
jgi:protein SCO1